MMASSSLCSSQNCHDNILSISKLYSPSAPSLSPALAVQASQTLSNWLIWSIPATAVAASCVQNKVKTNNPWPCCPCCCPIELLQCWNLNEIVSIKAVRLLKAFSIILPASEWIKLFQLRIENIFVQKRLKTYKKYHKVHSILQED